MVIENGHVAIVVTSIAEILPEIETLGFHIGEIEEFPTEGTKEVYVGSNHSLGQLLFIEPIIDGPYMESLRNRGPGLHHVCFSVKNLNEYIDGLSGTGWFLHPASIKTIHQSNAAWVLRPGIPSLFEIQEVPGLHEESNPSVFVSSIELPEPVDKVGMLESLGSSHIHSSSEQLVWLTIKGKRFSVNDLIGIPLEVRSSVSS